MKSEADIWREYQRVRDLVQRAETAGVKREMGLLHGAQQALGWALDQLRAPSDADELIRKAALGQRQRPRPRQPRETQDA